MFSETPVRLLVNMIQTHPSLVIGSEGVTCGFSRLGEEYVAVRFPWAEVDVAKQDLWIEGVSDGEEGEG